MNQNLKKMISYYKPYRAVFAADMLFATLFCGSGTDHSTGCAVCHIDSRFISSLYNMMLRQTF